MTNANNTYRILDAAGNQTGTIDLNASDAAFAAVLKSLGADHFEWDGPNFYEACAETESGELKGVLTRIDT